MFLQNGIMNHFHTVWTGLELVAKEAVMGATIRNSYIIRQLHIKEFLHLLLLKTVVPVRVQFENTKIAHIRKRIAKPRVTESKNFQLLLMTFDIQERCIVPLLLPSSFSHLKVVVYCFGIWSFLWFPLSFTDLNYKSRKRSIGPSRSQVINWCVFFSDLFYVPCQAIDENCINSSMKDLPPGKVCRWAECVVH